MPRQGQGLTDKLYWRAGISTGDIRHCFKRAASGLWRYVSLCGREGIDRVHGQDIRRPRVKLRCGRCDAAEITRRGWDGSGPTTTGGS